MVGEDADVVESSALGEAVGRGVGREGADVLHVGDGVGEGGHEGVQDGEEEQAFEGRGIV